MASYLEIRGLFNSDLVNKVEVAVIVAANNLASGTPNTAQKAWIAHAFNSPNVEAKKALMAVLADNVGLTVDQITTADDVVVQTKVDAIVPILIDALAGV